MRLLPRTRRRRGVATCELAIFLPFLALMFVVAVDYCRVFYCTQTVQGCAQAAALYASGTAVPAAGVSAADAAKQAAVADGVSLNPPLQTDNVAVTVADGTATVTVTYVFQTITSYPGVGGPVTITRTVKMAVAPTVGS